MPIEYVFHQLTSENGGKQAVKNRGSPTTLPIIHTASVGLRINGQPTSEIACGETVLLALFNAFCRAARLNLDIRTYTLEERYRKGCIVGRACVIVTDGKYSRKAFNVNPNPQKAFLIALSRAATAIRDAPLTTISPKRR